MLGSHAACVLDAEPARARLAEIAATLGVTVDPDVRTGDLSLGQQQHVEIIKALWKGSRVLILDEPTSMLTPQGIAELQKVLVRLKAGGLAIIFITHKLHEAIAIGDRVTILKQGRVVGHAGPDDMAGATPAELQGASCGIMFGEEAEAARPTSPSCRRRSPERRQARARLGRRRCWSWSASRPSGDGSARASSDVSLVLHQGEILGVAGVDGNGQRALAEVIAGQRRADGRRDPLFGAPDRPARRLRAPAAGPALRHRRPPGRGRRRLATRVGLNLVLKRIGDAPFWRRGAIDRAAIDATARELIEEFDIRTPSSATRIGKLSGGNIQKALLARELSFEPGSWCSTSRPTAWTCARRSPSASASGRSPREGVAVDRHLHRPRRADRPVRPGGGAVRRAARGHVRQRARRGRAHRRADGRASQARRDATWRTAVEDAPARASRADGARSRGSPISSSAPSLAAPPRARYLRRSCSRPRARPVRVLSRHHRGGIELLGLPGQHHAHGAGPARSRRAHRRLPRRALEPGPASTCSRRRGGRPRAGTSSGTCRPRSR